MLPATLSIITNVFDDAERARAIAIWAGGTGLAAAIGPLVGGGLLDAGFWWGSVLLINVPIVAVALAAIARVVPESRDPHPARLDLTGVLLSVAGLFALVYGIIHAGQTGQWTAPAALGAMGLGVALIAAFVWGRGSQQSQRAGVVLVPPPRVLGSPSGLTCSVIVVSGATTTQAPPA